MHRETERELVTADLKIAKNSLDVVPAVLPLSLLKMEEVKSKNLMINKMMSDHFGSIEPELAGPTGTLDGIPSCQNAEGSQKLVRSTLMLAGGG